MADKADCSLNMKFLEWGMHKKEKSGPVEVFEFKCDGAQAETFLRHEQTQTKC